MEGSQGSPYARFVAGIDIGGTFTDAVVVDRQTGLTVFEKVATTPDDPSRGALQALQVVGEQLGDSAFLPQTETIVHGTTVTTNAVLTRTGASTGVITTRGFRDMLDIRRGIRDRRYLYDNKYVQPPSLVARHRRVGVGGRIGKHGVVLEDIDAAEVRDAAALLVADGVEAIAVGLMHSYANETHERQVAGILAEAFPEVDVSVSVDVSKQVRLYPRLSTTVLNANVRPVLGRYLSRFEAALRAEGFAGALLIMQSNGGVATAESCESRPATTLLSGPAAGPIAGSFYALAGGYRDCVVADMGGTSFEAALVRDGAPSLSEEGEVGGHLVGLPLVDVHTVGAGGGSIAWVDEGGILHVGPQSAGAVPGPACYAQGGTAPTCSDADVVLGYLDPTFFLGGRIELDAARAADAIRTHVADRLKLSVVEAAAGIFEVVNLTMAAAINEITVQRGHDPREFVLVAAGGAGGVHGGMIAAELGIETVVVPRHSAVLCAMGMLLTDIKHDYSESYPTTLDSVDLARLRLLFEEMRRKGAAALAREAVPESAFAFTLRADMRYVGQHHEIVVPLEWEIFEQADPRQALARALGERHSDLYGFSLDGAPAELLVLRLTACGERPTPDLALAGAGGPAISAPKGERSVYNASVQEFVDVDVFDADSIGTGWHATGPTLIESRTTTILVPTGFDAECDHLGSFVLRRT